MDMEPQPQPQPQPQVQPLPWEEGEQQEEEEIALLRRQSRRQDCNRLNALAQQPPVNGEANGGNVHAIEEENKDNADQKNSVYYDSNQGNESVEGNYTGFKSSVLETNSKCEELHIEANNFDIKRILSTEINHLYHKDSSDEIFSCLTPSSENILSEEKNTNLEHLDNKTAVDTDVDLLDEISQESTAIDVERVLENQNTHDLYCPNCNSCITRRVILRRRKRKVRNISHKSKHDKFEKHSAADVTTDQNDNTVIIGSSDSLTPAADDENHDRKPDVFRCLSCFSLFIPTGNGFKLFQVFRDSDENGEVQNVQNTLASKKSWFFSILASDKRKQYTDQGSRAPEHSVVDGINQQTPSRSSENMLSCHGSDHPVASLGETSTDKARVPAEDSHIKPQQASRAPEHSEVDGINQHTSSRCSENMLHYPGSDHPAAPLGDTNPVKIRAAAEDSHIKSQQVGLESLNSMAESILLERPLMAIDRETNMAMGNKAIADHNVLKKSIEGVSSQNESFCSVRIVKSATTETLETKMGAVTHSAKELITISGVSIDVRKESDIALGKKNIGNRAPEHSEVDGINQKTPSCSSENMPPSHGSDHHVAHLSETSTVKARAPTEDSQIKPQQASRAPEHSEVDGINQHTSSCCSENMLHCHGSDHPVAPLSVTNPVKTRAGAEDFHMKSQQGGLESFNSMEEFLLLEKPLMTIDRETNMAMGNKAIMDHNGLEKSIEGASSQNGSFCSVGIVNSATTEPLETQKGVVTSSAKELIPLSGVSVDVGKKSDIAIGKNNIGDDVLVIVETQPAEVLSSQRTQNVDIPVNTWILPRTEINVGENGGPEATEANQWDILKCIVYGGLLESITSLGVVTSAAAAGAATLDIIAMGLANLMAGLIIVAHNLRELKNDHAGKTSTHMNKEEDRYQQLLGRREKFLFHATVVVLSYLIFGLMSPVIYGFSFGKSDDRDLKIAAVAGSSIACIILLAVGKVYIQKPPRSYIKTVLYYVSIGLLTSGLSYVVGELIKKLLEKLQSLEINSMKTGGWASY